MVVFTCNNCSESIQKPRVLKHISYECKRKNNRASLCCIDCLKDFDSNTYVDHTKCVTELERYSGSNYIPKSSSNKGERKQNSWINVVRSMLDQSSLSQNQRELLEAISHFENVPRKKAKFQNFIKSSIRNLRVSPHVVETVFELIDKEFKNSSISASENTKSLQQNCDEADKRGSCIKEHNDAEVCNGNDAEMKNETLEKERKKKCKQIDESEVVKIDDVVPMKKQKKKKKKEKNDVDAVASRNENLITVYDESENIREKVKIPAVEVPCDIGNDSQVTEKKKKKKKIDNMENSNTFANETQPVLSESCSIRDRDDLKKSDKISKNMKIHEKDEESTVEQEYVIKKNRKRKLETDPEIENEAQCNKRLAVNVEENNERKLEILRDAEKNTADVERTVLNRNKKKKKCPSEEAVQEHNLELMSDINHQNSADGEISTSRFNWKAVVVTILLKSKNHEVSLNKMKKKITKKYLQFHQDEKSSEDIIKKFDKRVKKIANIEVNNERIRLLE